MDDDEAEFIGLILQPSGITPDSFQRVGLLLQNSIDISGTIPGLEWDFSGNDWKLDNGETRKASRVITLI
jgi:hypothetical protein